MTRRLRWAFLGVLAPLGAGCVDDSFSAPAEGFVITVPGLRWHLELGDTARFEAVVTNSARGVMPGYRVTWRSSDPIVLTVDSSGRAVARAVGTADITAFAANASAQWSLAVIRRVAGVRITAESVTLVPTDREFLAAQLLDSSGQAIPGNGNVLMELAGEIAWSVADTVIGVIGPEAPLTPIVGGRREGTTWVIARRGDVADSIPLSVVLLSFSDVTVGGDRTCGRTPTGAHYCWPNESAWYSPQWMPRALPAPDSLVTLTLGTAHGCGFIAGGAAFCFGSNEYGQRGLGALIFPPDFTPVAGKFRFTTLAAGDYHTCGITSDHEVACWGLTRDRQAGDSILNCASSGKASIAAACAPAPQLLRDASAALPFTALSAGSSHTCGLRTDSLAYCWGRLAGVRADRSRPVSPTQRFVALASSSAMACGLDATGSVYCWGDDVDGLGDGQTDTSAVPVAVAAGLHFESLAGLRGNRPTAETDGGMCGIAEDGALICWGLLAAPTPTRAAAPLYFTSASMGAIHGCGLATDAMLYCWGSEYVPALGFPITAFERDVPSRVIGQR